MKLEKLTPEQEADIPVFRKKYLDIACGGARIDRPELESAIADAYAVINKPAPRLFIFDSPAACMLAIKIFEMRASGKFKLGDQLWDQLRNQLASQLRNQLGDQLWDQLWDQLGGQLGNQLGDQLGDQLGGQLRNQRIWNPNHLWGSQDLYWIAWGKFAEKIGVKLEPETSRNLDIMDRIGAQCEWWWPSDNVVIASQRPSSVKWNNSRQLHCEDGPAVEYADGYSLFSWNCVRLPAEWVVNKDQIDPLEILKCENVEQRAAGAACIGWPRMLEKMDYKIIDSDPNPLHGDIIEVRLDGLPQPGRFLKAECPRNGTIVEGVPNDIKTVLEAQAWRVGLSPDQFEYPTIRT